MKQPGSIPDPDYFYGGYRTILMLYDIEEYFSNVFKFRQALTGKKPKIGKLELELIAEQAAHKDYYKDYRDKYWAARAAHAKASRGNRAISERSMQTDDPYFYPPRGYCSCSPSACRCNY